MPSRLARSSRHQRNVTDKLASPPRQRARHQSPPTTTSAALGFSFDTNVPEQTIVLTNARARYTFTSRGGGLKSVELLDYPETISARWKR